MFKTFVAILSVLVSAKSRTAEDCKHEIRTGERTVQSVLFHPKF